MSTFIVACAGGFGLLAYLAAKDLARQLEGMGDNLARLESLINKHAGRIHALEDSEKLCRSGILFVAEKMDEAEHHRNLLDPDRFEPSVN